MKNLFKTIVLVALAVSCAKEIGSDSANDVTTRRYSLSFAESTKTELSGTGSTRQVKWNSGDQIQYYTEPNQSSPASANVVLNGNSAYIDIEPGRADVVINAVYGATQLNSASSTENTMYVNSPVKNSQKYTSFSQAHICAAFSDDIENPNLTFHNAAAILKFTSAATIHKIVFRGNNSEVITAGSNGSLKITHSAGALTVTPTSAGGTSVTIQTGGAESEFYIAVLPVQFEKGITVDCYDSNLELIATKKTTNAVNAVSPSGAPKVLNLGNVQDWLNNSLPVAVDLGLSVKWARTNLGAAVPEEYGDYFAWGETAPKAEYKWTNYAYELGTGRTGPFSKYVLDSDLGTVDHKTVLDPADDAAHAILGGDWRMPTKEEVEELMTSCQWTWTTRNGVSGYRVTSNKSGYSGVSIFLPANGIFGNSVSKVGTEGNYWSASLSADESNFALSPYFSNSSRESGNCYRYFGLGIRPVEGAVVPVASIDMPATLDLIVGRTSTLSATISPGNATYKGLTWSSSDESIATVDAAGKVTAVATGQATITAYSADASTTVACKVTVYQLAQYITLDHAELELYVGDAPVTLTATILPSEYTMKTINWKSSDSSIATVDSEGKVTAISAGTTKITVKATDGSNVSAACMVTVKINLSLPDAVEAVDLGLPSGLKWATMNVGATKPEEYGEYFAWGETQPKSGYSWSTYKWCNGSYDTLTKYNTKSSYGTVDNKTVLDPEDDAAHVNWGGSWRMPTKEEQDELRNNCTWTRTTQNGVNGRLVTGPNGKSIFLPAVGRRYDAYLDGAGSWGDYWSSSLCTDYPGYAYVVGFNSNNVYCDGYGRSVGHSVRPVFDDRIHPVSVTLNKSDLSLFVGTSEILTATVLPDNATDKSITWSSSDESVATVDQDGKVTGVKEGTAFITATTNDGGYQASCSVAVVMRPKINGYEYVDLGLPSGIKWATMNVGATKPEEYGAYFAWGETQLKSNYYSWSTYKWCNDSSNTQTKYNTSSSYGTVDNKTVLDPEDDAAHVHWGGSWRMPTDDEWTELRTKCTWTWTSQNGVNGRLVTGPNGKSIFLPAAGLRYGTSLDGAVSNGNYWSSSLNTDNPSNAYSVYFNSDDVYRRNYYRCGGRSVRPVTE